MVLKLFTLILLFIAPLHSWGFSLQRLTEYKNQALKEKLAYSNQWLRLGHYRKSSFGSYYSPIQGHFFISAKGSKDPEAELLATLDTLFSESSEENQAQCRYLARTSWLKETLHIHPEDLVTCSKQEQWKNQLGAKVAYLVFAASDLSSAASSFGHTFLRLHNPLNKGKLDLLDYGVNYAAATGKEGGALYALKGLFGYYPGSYSMLPYHQKIREYTNLEGRDLWEYKLRLTPSEVEMIVNHLLELDDSYAPYYFSDDNCSKQILELIEVAKPDLDLSSSFADFVIPLDTVKLLEKKWLLENESTRPSLHSEWTTRYSHLSSSEQIATRDIIQTRQLNRSSFTGLDNRSKALSIEASLSYLAMTEYRDQKDLKNEKYVLSVARSQLGSITEPIQIAQSKSPLSSLDSRAASIGYGKIDNADFYSFKWRRGFHDLLSDDSGLAPFSQLNFLSLDLQYRPTRQNWDLQQMTLLNIISTYPWSQLENPISWKVDVGTQPKFAPYVSGGIGASFDLPLRHSARWANFLISENAHLTERASSNWGLESFVVNVWSDNIRSLLDVKFLYSPIHSKSITDFSAGVSYSIHKIEYRFEAENRDQEDSWKISIIF